MANLVEIHSLLVGAPQLQQRFIAARVKASWDILNESADTDGHTERLAWAEKILDDSSADLTPEYNRFLSNTTIQANGTDSTDNDIQFVVNSFVNTWAGVEDYTSSSSS